jgi:hypothetical protein
MVINSPTIALTTSNLELLCDLEIVFGYDELEIVNALVKFVHLHGVVYDDEIMVVMKIYHNDLRKLYVDPVVTFVENIFQNFNRYLDWWKQIIIIFQFGMNHTFGRGEIVVVMKIYHDDLDKLYMDLIVTFVDNIFRTLMDLLIGRNKSSLNFNME